MPRRSTRRSHQQSSDARGFARSRLRSRGRRAAHAKRPPDGRAAGSRWPCAREPDRRKSTRRRRGRTACASIFRLRPAQKTRHEPAHDDVAPGVLRWSRLVATKRNRGRRQDRRPPRTTIARSSERMCSRTERADMVRILRFRPHEPGATRNALAGPPVLRAVTAFDGCRRPTKAALWKPAAGGRKTSLFDGHRRSV